MFKISDESMNSSCNEHFFNDTVITSDVDLCPPTDTAVVPHVEPAVITIG